MTKKEGETMSYTTPYRKLKIEKLTRNQLKPE